MMPPKVKGQPRKLENVTGLLGRTRTVTSSEASWEAAIRAVIERGSIRYVSRGVSIQTQSYLGVPFRVDGERVLLLRECLGNADDAALLLRHALEANLWQRVAGGRTSLSDALTAALLACHAAGAYARAMCTELPTRDVWPSWLAQLICIVTAEVLSGTAVAEHTRQHQRSLLSMQGCPQFADRPILSDVLEQVVARVTDLRPLAMSTEALLLTDGDSRLRLQEPYALNMYGCSPDPREETLHFGSCTATSTSAATYAHLEEVRRNWMVQAWRQGLDATQVALNARIRERLLAVCGLPRSATVRLLPSGTDGELLATQQALLGHRQTLVNIVVAPYETGSGVPLAAAGRHFDKEITLGPCAYGESAIAQTCNRVVVRTVAIREEDGVLRSAQAIDTDVVELVRSSVRDGHRVLLHVLDVSKAGVCAPSIACVTELRQKYGERVIVVVDAAQWRLEPRALATYHDAGFWCIVTGSKFMGGAPFSGALVMPADETIASSPAPMGVLLRWESGLVAAESLARLPAPVVAQVFARFARAVRKALDARTNCAALPESEGSALASGIFSFVVCNKGTPLGLTELKAVHRWLYLDLASMLPLSGSSRAIAATHCHVGQPVVLTEGTGHPVVALRIALSAPLVCAMADGYDVQPDVDTVFSKIDLILANQQRLQSLWGETA